MNDILTLNSILCYSVVINSQTVKSFQYLSKCGLLVIKISELIPYLILDMPYSLFKDLTIKICKRFQSHDLAKSLILL
jgi:hypothetical protein